MGSIVGTRQTASPISIHERPIIEKKGLHGWSSRRSHLSALWFRCPGVLREAINFSSSLVRIRDRARVVLPCVRDKGRAMRLISPHLGTRSRSGGKAEVLKWPRERQQVRRLTRGRRASGSSGERVWDSGCPRLSKKLKLGLAPTDEMGIILSCAFGKSATDWQIPR